MATRKPLTERQLAHSLKSLSLFSPTPKNTKLHATFSFKSHVEALVFIARITVHAEVMQHYPEVVFTHKSVKVTLTTSEVRGITTDDIKLAKKIESLKRD